MKNAPPTRRGVFHARRSSWRDELSRNDEYVRQYRQRNRQNLNSVCEVVRWHILTAHNAAVVRQRPVAALLKMGVETDAQVSERDGEDSQSHSID